MSEPSSPPAFAHERRRWLACGLALPTLGLAGCAQTQPSPGLHAPASASDQPTAPWQAWSMPGVQSVDLPAAPLPGSTAARQHRVMVYVPQGPAPAAGWPVVYVLDGNLMFPLLAQLVHNRGARGLEMRSGSAIVVGLGHVLPEGSGEVHDRAARTYDYTLPIAGVGPDSQGRAQGGADVFLDFIAQQLQPLLQARLPIDRQQQTLVGHSFGGLLTLHALFTRPGMFQQHIAASPSLWWGGGAILQECQQFIARFGSASAAGPHLPAALQLHLSQGSEELAARKAPGKAANPDRETAARAAQAVGLGHTADLPQALAGIAALRCTYQVWPGAGHGGTQLYACMQAAQLITA